MGKKWAGRQVNRYTGSYRTVFTLSTCVHLLNNIVRIDVRTADTDLKMQMR